MKAVYFYSFFHFHSTYLNTDAVIAVYVERHSVKDVLCSEMTHWLLWKEAQGRNNSFLVSSCRALIKSTRMSAAAGYKDIHPILKDFQNSCRIFTFTPTVYSAIYSYIATVHPLITSNQKSKYEQLVRGRLLSQKPDYSYFT